MAFFSIVIPVYNVEKTIKKALKSICNQSFKEVEVLLIDGLSTDNTITFAKQFIDQCTSISIKIFSAADSGIYDAMNKGIKRSIGEYLYFMGADDELAHENILQNIQHELMLNDYDLIYGNVKGNESGKTHVHANFSKVKTEGIHHQCVFYKKSLFQNIGNYDLRFPIAADYHLTIKAFLKFDLSSKYIDLIISKFGESGLSAQQFDYKFYAYHYRLLVNNKGNFNKEDGQKCLANSMYCCLFLLGKKKDMKFAWENMLFYIFRVKQLSFSKRIKSFKQMIYWTLFTN